MQRHAIRLTATLLSFAAGCAASGAVNFFERPRPPRPAPPPAEARPAPAPESRPPALPHADGEGPPSSPRITQTLVVRFPRLGLVCVRAVENFGERVRVEFADYETGQVIAHFPAEGAESFFFTPRPGVTFTNPFLRLKVLRPEGLPQPLVLAVAVTPGGSGCGFNAIVIGEVGGRLKRLTREPLMTSNQGGLFVGDLGGGRGLGAAAWDYIWDFDSEGHYSAHRYEIKLYPFDPRRREFRWGGALRSRRKHGGHGDGALAEFGLKYVDLLQDIHDVSVFLHP